MILDCKKSYGFLIPITVELFLFLEGGGSIFVGSQIFQVRWDVISLLMQWIYI